VATIGFIALFGMHFQPELITTKNSITLAILHVGIYVFFYACSELQQLMSKQSNTEYFKFNLLFK
jgi:hypothetical protein